MPTTETNGNMEQSNNQSNAPENLKVKRGLNEVPVSNSVTAVPAGDEDPEASQVTERDNQAGESDDDGPAADAPFEEVKL